MNLQEQLARATQAAEDLTKTYAATYEKWQQEIKSGSPTEAARIGAQLTDEVLPKLAVVAQLQAQIAEVEKRGKLTQDAVAAMELKGPNAERQARDTVRNLGRSIVEHARYKSFIESLGHDARGHFILKAEGEKASEIGRFWNNAELRSMRSNSLEIKSPGEWSGSNVSDAVRPFYRPDIVENPRRMPVMRRVVPTVPTTATDSVISTRESARRRLAAKLTATANSGSTTFTVDNIQGFEATAPFNSFTLDNGTSTETLTIQSINRTTGVITTTAASTINMAIGDYVYAANFIVTAEGQVAPRGLVELANYTVPICRIASHVKASLEKLRDITSAEDYINRNLGDLIADSEDLQFFYGLGGTSPSRIKGIWNDSDVATSARGSATALDHILNNIYDLADNNYTPTAALVSVSVHKSLATLKDSTGNYMLWMSQGNGGMAPRLNVVDLVMTNMLTSGHGVIADFSRACTIYDREQADISIHEVGNDALEHQRTILASERVGFGIERPLAIKKLTF